MRISDEGAKFITSFEGFRASPYKCTAGKLTVGYGHRIDADEQELFAAGPITKDMALIIFRNDVFEFECQVVACFNMKYITQRRFDALVSFVFNAGIGNATNKKISPFSSHMLVGDIQPAAEALMKWGLGQWKKSPGLERRRLMEAIMLLDGVHSPVVSEKAAKFGIIVK
jgi:lysozyme